MYILLFIGFAIYYFILATEVNRFWSQDGLLWTIIGCLLLCIGSKLAGYTYGTYFGYPDENKILDMSSSVFLIIHIFKRHFNEDTI